MKKRWLDDSYCKLRCESPATAFHNCGFAIIGRGMDYLDTLRCFVTVAMLAALPWQGDAWAARPRPSRAPSRRWRRGWVCCCSSAARAWCGTEAASMTRLPPILNDLHGPSRPPAVTQAEAQGLLSVTARRKCSASRHVAPSCRAFAGQPRVRGAHAVRQPAGLHLLDEGMDVAIHHIALPTRASCGVQVGALRRWWWHLPPTAQHGKPLHPADLSHHRAIGFAFDARAIAWTRWRHRPTAIHLDQQQQQQGGHCRRGAGIGLTRCPRLRPRASLRAGRLHRARRARTALCPCPVPRTAGPTGAARLWNGRASHGKESRC